MKFSWMNYDPAFLKSVLLASDRFQDEYEEIKKEDDIIGLVAKMNLICPYPDKNFIVKYRTIIERELLLKYPEVVRKVCSTLNITGVSFNIKQSQLTKKVMSLSLVSAYTSAILTIGGMDVKLTQSSKFKHTVAINTKELEIKEIPLYEFQKEAIKKLKKHYIDDDKNAGLLVMPTGSGKSRTTSCFLIQEMISRGYQILWIAHRHMLIDQAAECFYKFAGLSKIENPKIRDYRINCISGEHLSIKQVRNSEIIVASISSICRNKEHLRRILGRKVMIVVDEAHHTFAPTYQDTITFIRKHRKNTKLLGITATPVRAKENDSLKLLQLFDNNIVFDISLSDLIARGILADPVCSRIETGQNFEPEISIEEEKLIKRYKELPESLVSKIASSYARNQIIVKEYLDNKEKYGKTLIFAMNVLHCRLLYEELKNKKVKCGYVYSGKEDNSSVIEDFKHGKFDVLINVNIMTEGSDVPDIQTVFLTRPTESEVMLMQMIGRGMRGLKSHGTEKVNIVDFHDQWDKFNKWLNPEWLISDEKLEETSPKLKEHRKTDYIEYEWSLCKDVYNSCLFKATSYNKTVTLPVAWYTLIDEEGELYRMLVFEDQVQGFVEMIKDKKNWINDESITPAQILKKYFSYFCIRPSERDIELFMDNMRNCEEMPTARILRDRKKIDPYYVAKNAEENKSNIFEDAAKAYEESNIVKDLWGSVEEYQMAVCKAKIYGDKDAVLGIKIEELPVELIPFDRTPVYDINALAKEVIDEMFGGVYEGIGSIDWTDRPYKTYYGVFYHDDNSIRINSVLNSKDVPKEAVKFVIYHELLHRDNHYHDSEFKKLEHKYPNFEEHEAFLDGDMFAFDINWIY